jgi:hypothetical protein
VEEFNMVINLSDETIKTVYNSLKDSRYSLKRQLEVKHSNRNISPSKIEIIKHQLAEVEDALQVFEELIYGY